MALVRISKQLIEDVKHCTRNLQNREVGEIPAPTDTSVALTAQHTPSLRALFWGEHAHLADLMPRDWCVNTKVFVLTTVTTHDDGHKETTSGICFAANSVEVPLPPKTPTRYSHGHYSAATMDVPYEIVAEAAADPSHLHHLTAAPLFAMTEYEKAVRKVRKSWMAREAQIVQFLEKCKSLNEAIKLWPQVKLYVPKLYIDTVEMPVVRSQAVVRKEKVLADVNTDDLTAAAIAAKLQGFI